MEKSTAHCTARTSVTASTFVHIRPIIDVRTPVCAWTTTIFATAITIVPTAKMSRIAIEMPLLVSGVQRLSWPMVRRSHWRADMAKFICMAVWVLSRMKLLPIMRSVNRTSCNSSNMFSSELQICRSEWNGLHTMVAVCTCTSNLKLLLLY